FIRTGLLLFTGLGLSLAAHAEPGGDAFFSTHSSSGLSLILFILLATALLISCLIYLQAGKLRQALRDRRDEKQNGRFKNYINSLSSEQIDAYLKSKRSKQGDDTFHRLKNSGLIMILLL